MSYTAPGVFPIGLLNWCLDLLFAQNGPAICPIKYSSIFQAIISSLSRKYSVISYPGHQLPLFSLFKFFYCLLEGLSLFTELFGCLRSMFDIIILATK